MSVVAAIQMTSTEKLTDNLMMVEQLLETAALQQAKLIVLPEMFPMVSFDSEDKLQIKENYGSGVIQDFLSTQAKKLGIWIVAGTIPIACDDASRVRAACIVYNDQGMAVARYDKIHLFDVTISDTEKYLESAATQPGDSVVVVDTPFGKLGLAVCYDIRFPELFRAMAMKGAEIIAIPAAFTVKTGKAHWEVLLRSRAIENFCYVIAAGQVGLHNSGRRTYGHSMIIEPWGNIASERQDDMPGIVAASIDLNKLHLLRKQIPIFEHCKLL